MFFAKRIHCQHTEVVCAMDLSWRMSQSVSHVVVEGVNENEMDLQPQNRIFDTAHSHRTMTFVSIEEIKGLERSHVRPFIVLLQTGCWERLN